jgi:putative FmdB family regulatory protein
MPTYEYECSICGHRFEQFQSIKDRPLTKCSECGGRVERLLGCGAGLLFKGSGFYITDYRSRDYRQKAKADVSAPAAKPEAPKTTTDGGQK